MVILRPEQAQIMDYSQGKMGISAVPGSGKTWTLSYLAADLIRRGLIGDEQEILVVTLVNSAVDNFYRRISSFVNEIGLLPGIGYRVRTLHGLAHDIVRERPALLGLDNNFIIIDERESEIILKDVSKAWLEAHKDVIEPYLNLALSQSSINWVRRDQLPELVRSIAYNFIRIAKDNQQTPQQLRNRITSLPVPFNLAQMGCEIYENYQEALAHRAAVDFDDLIRLALQALETDPILLERLKNLWPYILEDEAQDSSRLQEQILRKLTTPDGNWVRVGDPNQAIYETFTTASPEFLNRFLTEPDVMSQQLPVSGRSSQKIIQLANYLVQWTEREHPNLLARPALHGPPFIQETSPGDPQINPPNELSTIRMAKTKYTPDSEIQAIVKPLEQWLPINIDQTVAVLTPRNQRAFELINELIIHNIPYNDSLLRSSSSTRFSAGALGNILRYLALPHSAAKLATAYLVWRRADRLEQDAKIRMEQVSELIGNINHVEDYLWPSVNGSWLDETGIADVDQELYEQLVAFRQLVRRWQQAVTLPIDQLILTLSHDLFTEPAELAMAHKLATLLRWSCLERPDLQLPDLAEQLGEIARNERRFIGFSDDDGGFDPNAYPGTVVVATMHKAKGLEWDRVYLMSVNNYDFPSGKHFDSYISEKYFIRDSLNLEAEAVAQLMLLFSSNENEWYREGNATQQARISYIQERLRLFYVGITRAKKDLIVTWNCGKNAKAVIEPAVPFTELMKFQDQKEK